MTALVNSLRALESPNVQSAEDTRGAADYSTFPIFFCRFAAGVGITVRGLLKIPEEKQIIKLCPFLL
jgi:hypothetical protein